MGQSKVATQQWEETQNVRASHGKHANKNTSGCPLWELSCKSGKGEGTTPLHQKQTKTINERTK